jgi:hypothetical protein
MGMDPKGKRIAILVDDLPAFCRESIKVLTSVPAMAK